MIGYSILAKYKLEFDLSRHKMRWTRLNFNPPPPRSLGVKGKAGGGLNAMAGVIKMLSLFTGRRKNPALIPRGFVGIALKEVDDKVIVRQVLRKSPAAKAGVKVGDRIMKIGEDNVDRLADVFSAAVHLNPGTTIPMTILRAGNKEELTITPGKGL